MPQTMQLTFRGLEPLESITTHAQKRADKLPTFYPHIQACQVVLEAPPRHHRHGAAFRVRIELAVPGQQLVAGAHNGSSTGHEDLYAAIDDAFADAERVLKRHAERLRESRRAPAP